MFFRALNVAIVFLIGTIGIVSTVFARVEKSLKDPVLVQAKKLYYHQKKDKVIALGNVEIMQEGRILLADQLIYNRRNNVIKARGNISLLEPNGNVYFAHTATLKDDLKKGVIENFSARLSNDALFAAQSANRVNEKVTELKRAVFSSCPVCKDSRVKEPQWQLKADKVTINEEKERVIYKDASVEIYGLPVAYTPYFSHPTPDAKRKSGFLIPSFSKSSALGANVKVPYYYNIAPDKDVVIAPVYTSKEGMVLEGDYRQLLPQGSYNMRGSITNPDKVDGQGHHVAENALRGHVEGDGNFDINDTWSWGFIGKRSSDDTYLKKYNYGNEDVLTSRLYMESLEDRNYVTLDSLTFQGLNPEDDPDTTPVILPLAEAHFETLDPRWKSTLSADINSLVLIRSEGTQTRRVSTKGEWKKTLVSSNGHLVDLRSSLRADGYASENINSLNRDNFDSTALRVLPEMEVAWHYPLIQHNAMGKWLVEPVSQLIVSPYGGNPDKIPNEDSQDLEFSDANLFSAHRFTGLDRVESGPRVNYGVRSMLQASSKGQLSALLGQNYRAKEDALFTPKSGLEDNFSDYVGRIGFDKADQYNIAYHFRLDKDHFTIRRNELRTKMTFSPVTLDMDYIRLNEAGLLEDQTGNTLKEIFWPNASLKLTDDWSIAAFGNRNMAEGNWVYAGTQLLYNGACTNVSLSWTKDFTYDRDASSSSTFALAVSLKNFN